MSSAPQKPPGPPPPADLRHRRAPEADIVDIVALEAWGVELAAGRTQEAREGAAILVDNVVDIGAGYAQDADGKRLFDPVEVNQLMGWLNTMDIDRRWAERKRITNAGVAASAQATHAAYGGGSSARFRVRFRRCFDLGHLEPGARGRLRLPLSLHSRYHEDFTVAIRANQISRQSAWCPKVALRCGLRS